VAARAVVLSTTRFPVAAVFAGVSASIAYVLRIVGVAPLIYAPGHVVTFAGIRNVPEPTSTTRLEPLVDSGIATKLWRARAIVRNGFASVPSPVESLPVVRT
jgi:hypothetical protein